MTDTPASLAALGIKPVAWMHTLHMGQGWIYERVTQSQENGHGIPGQDYPEEYNVITTSLYSKTDLAPLIAKARRVEALEAALDPDLTKAAYIGEFRFNIAEFDGEGGEIYRPVTVPWTTIKEIMVAIKARAALKENTDG